MVFNKGLVLLRVFHQPPHSLTGDGAGGFIAGNNQQEEEVAKVFLGQGLIFDCAAE